MENPKYDVAKLRRSLGLTQAEFAKALFCSERSVRRWEVQMVAPQSYYIRKMDDLKAAKFAGTIPERPATAAPAIKRKLPAPTPNTMLKVGIAPSSY